MPEPRNAHIELINDEAAQAVTSSQASISESTLEIINTSVPYSSRVYNQSDRLDEHQAMVSDLLEA